jgi:hypothetical protein
MKWSPFTILLISCPVLAPARTAPGPKDLPSVERGTFILHKVLKPTGRETYEIARDGDRLVLRSEFEYTDRRTKVPLEATLRLRDDLTPEHFLIKGKTSRFTRACSRAEGDSRSEGNKVWQH